jgi:hypothetical protein
LHPAQDEAEQPPQPELDDDEDESPEPLPMPKLDMRFFVFFEPQSGQTTSGFEPKTSFSNSCLHLAHWYS